MQWDVRVFCSSQNNCWKFVPECTPHFGGLWEAAMKSFKVHIRRVVGDAKLTYEELATVLTQIEPCLNSRLLAALPEPNDGLEALTPRHFLIGRPLEVLPDPFSSYQSCLLLKRWQPCQVLVRHFGIAGFLNTLFNSGSSPSGTFPRVTSKLET